jgi:histidine triad (HIT) family protein
MFSHEPAGYDCPVCAIVRGDSNASDVVYRDDHATAFISSTWWDANAGHVVVVPNVHYENIYVIPDDVLGAVQSAGKRVALALKAVYGCHGTSFRQHNEPAGNQEVWHYHLHVFPRYVGDDLYARYRERRTTTPAEREPYARKLRQSVSDSDSDSNSNSTQPPQC